MKWLILLGLLIVLAGIIATRYHRQIKMAIYVWRMFRQMRQGGKTDERQARKIDNPKSAALVRCAKCGTWIPPKNALNLRSGIYYCSKICLETIAKVN